MWRGRPRPRFLGRNLWEGSVPVAKLHRLFPIGTLLLAAGLVLHNWTHGRYTEFTAGLLIGMSLVFVIAGFVGQPHGSSKG